jgi:hypothetical protein
MRLRSVPLGLLFNFDEIKLGDGVSRLLPLDAIKPST